MKILVSEIKVGDRHRKDMGDLTSLADSIAALGLLQPIGIAPDNTLIFGERRLRACRDVLGLVEIEVRVIDMPSIVVGENAENEVRKDFTPSERVAIARAIADEIGEGRGSAPTWNFRKILRRYQRAKRRENSPPKRRASATVKPSDKQRPSQSVRHLSWLRRWILARSASSQHTRP